MDISTWSPPAHPPAPPKEKPMEIVRQLFPWKDFRALGKLSSLWSSLFPGNSSRSLVSPHLGGSQMTHQPAQPSPSACSMLATRPFKFVIFLHNLPSSSFKLFSYLPSLAPQGIYTPCCQCGLRSFPWQIIHLAQIELVAN